MLPFRRGQRPIALDDSDIVDVGDADISGEVEMELDLDDALEVSASPDARDVSGERDISSRGPEALLISEPELVSDDDDEDIRETKVAGAKRKAGVPATLGPATFGKSEAVVHVPRSALTKLLTADDGYLTPTPSPFARSASGELPKPTHLMGESLAPVAMSADDEAPTVARPGKTWSMLAREAKIAKSDKRGDQTMLVRTRDDAAERWADRGSDREVASLALRGRAPRLLRAAAFMIAGGAAAAAFTAYLMRTENVQSMQNTNDMAALPQLPAIVAPPINAGVTAPAKAQAAAPPAEVKFDDKDAIMVPAASAVPATPAAVPAPVAAPDSAAHHHATAGTAGATSATGAHPKPKTTSNALVPDNNDTLAKDLSKPLPAAPASGPKDPVAEAQLRASMR
jgi:hypothetical protein